MTGYTMRIPLLFQEVPNFVDAGGKQGAADDYLRAHFDLDGTGPIAGSYVGDLHLSGGSGADTVLGYIGNDILEGSACSDIVLGEASAIVINALSAGDPGDDRIHGDVDVDLDSAIAQGAGQTASGINSDWLSGEDGVDFVVGSTGHDALFGGCATDLLVTGAGGDDVNGDGDYVPDTAAPWSGGAMPGNEFDRAWLCVRAPITVPQKPVGGAR